MAINMGFPKSNYAFKRPFRHIFAIPGIVGHPEYDGLFCKLNEKSARPNISFKEMEVQHLGQTISFPGKVVFEPINITVWDTIPGGGRRDSSNNPVWQWVNSWYDFYQGVYKSPIGLKRSANIRIYDGCGNLLEKWVYENAYPINVNFGELDMGANNEVLTIEMQLKYDRAYLVLNDSAYQSC
jgi:hypothetical protein